VSYEKNIHAAKKGNCPCGLTGGDLGLIVTYSAGFLTSNDSGVWKENLLIWYQENERS